MGKKELFTPAEIEILKVHYARVLKKIMSKVEFEAWLRYAIELREQAERKEISFDDFVKEIKK